MNASIKVTEEEYGPWASKGFGVVEVVWINYAMKEKQSAF